jgi:hypothetical protein
MAKKSTKTRIEVYVNEDGQEITKMVMDDHQYNQTTINQLVTGLESNMKSKGYTEEIALNLSGTDYEGKPAEVLSSIIQDAIDNAGVNPEGFWLKSVEESYEDGELTEESTPMRVEWNAFKTVAGLSEFFKPEVSSRGRTKTAEPMPTFQA